MTVAKTREWLRGVVVAVPTPFPRRLLAGPGRAPREHRGETRSAAWRTGDGVLLVAGAGWRVPDAPHATSGLPSTRTSRRGNCLPGLATVTSIQHSNMARGLSRWPRAAEDAGIDGSSRFGVPCYYPGYPNRMTSSVFVDAFRRTHPRIPPDLIYSTWWEGGLDIDWCPPVLGWWCCLMSRLVDLVGVRRADRFTEGMAAIADTNVQIDNQAPAMCGVTSWAGTGSSTHLSNFWPEYPLFILAGAGSSTTTSPFPRRPSEPVQVDVERLGRSRSISPGW